MKHAVLVLVLAACHGKPSVGGAPPERHPLDPSTITAPGVVEPWAGEVKLAAAEAGQLVELLVVEGQHVRPGDLLARLEDSQQRSAVAIATSELRDATAAIAALASTREDVEAAEAELEAAAARAKLQRREHERTEQLGSSGAVPTADVERSTAAARVEDAGQRLAAARLRATRRGGRPAEVEAARARRDAAEARVAAAAAALKRREIRATSDGVVLWSRYHAGEFYAPERGPLVVIGDLARLQLRLEVNDLDAAGVTVGARCELRGDGGEAAGTGTVVQIALEHGSRSVPVERPSQRADARVIEVVVAIDPGTRLVPGQRVWGNIARAHGT